MERKKFIVFSVRERFFALPSTDVKEIVESDQALKKIFYNRGGVLRGLMDFEGNVISVLDSVSLLEVEEDGVESLVLICIDRAGGKPVGITATAVVGMEMVNSDDIKGSPEDETNFTVGFVKEGRGDKERVITILDLDKFFNFITENVAGSN